MNIKKIKIRDNNFQLEKPKLPEKTKKLEYVLSDDYLITVKELFEPSRVVTQTPTTLDHNFTISEPQHVTEVEKKDTSRGVPTFFVRPTFNYLSLDWEQKLGALDELQSPLFYSQEEMHLGDVGFLTPKINRQFAKDIDSLDTSFSRKNRIVENRHRNILFGSKYNYKPTNSAKKNYPFYIQVNLQSSTRQEFKNRLKELGLYELLIEDYVQEAKQILTVGEKDYPIFDFNTWISNSDFQINENNVKILSPSYTKPNNFFYNLKKLNFIGFTRQMIKTHQRKLFGVLNNVDCYNEVMFYRFDKYNNRTGRLIQTFWLPADETIDFIDTQVKYGTIYRYSCTAHVLVMGASYSVSENDKGKLVSTIEPSLKIIEIPMFEDTCNIIQPPQPIPEIEFHNDKYNRNDITVLLKLNANYYDAEFVPLEELELEQNSLVANYNKLNRRPYFHYETEHALFEIFKLDKVPDSYDEIDNYKIGEIRHPIASIATAIRDKIGIGKKYYYVFRSINSHGLLSNPTPIYEVEMIEDADETFLKVNVVEIKQPEKYQQTRTMSQDVQLLPSSLHTIFDQSQAPVSEGTIRNKIRKLKLGIAEDPIWGKRFKFRITSKDTGKKIDINVNVELTRNKTIEDFK